MKITAEILEKAITNFILEDKLPVDFVLSEINYKDDESIDFAYGETEEVVYAWDQFGFCMFTNKESKKRLAIIDVDGVATAVMTYVFERKKTHDINVQDKPHRFDVE